MGFFTDIAHTVLLGVLLLQTAILALWGDKPWRRLLGSLIAPLVYMLLEFREGTTFVLNAAHTFFWFFSALTGLLQALFLAARRQKPKVFLEFSLTFINVLIFLLVYFYFDTHVSLDQLAAQGKISVEEAALRTEIGRIFDNLPEFLSIRRTSSWH
jgi:hypothetical protein